MPFPCCRLRLDVSELRKRGGGLFDNPLTGSIGVFTINLPRIGYLSSSKVNLSQGYGGYSYCKTY